MKEYEVIDITNKPRSEEFKKKMTKLINSKDLKDKANNMIITIDKEWVAHDILEVCGNLTAKLQELGLDAKLDWYNNDSGNILLKIQL